MLLYFPARPATDKDIDNLSGTFDQRENRTEKSVLQVLVKATGCFVPHSYSALHSEPTPAFTRVLYGSPSIFRLGAAAKIAQATKYIPMSTAVSKSLTGSLANLPATHELYRIINSLYVCDSSHACVSFVPTFTRFFVSGLR